MHIKLSVAILACSAAFAQQVPIDTARSTITIHVGKSGLFSVAGHEHWVNAPISSGTIDQSARRVEFAVESAKVTVKPDPKVDAKTQAQIQKDMEEMTLETRKYPEIAFRSSKIEQAAGGAWSVTGDLSLHGVTKPVTVAVKRSGEAFSAHVVLKQTDFGIKPVSVAGGAVKVKNEVDLDFQIFPRN